MPIHPGSGAVRNSPEPFSFRDTKHRAQKYRLIGPKGMAFLARTMH
jgi:hypothetical protein